MGVWNNGSMEVASMELWKNDSMEYEILEE